MKGNRELHLAYSVMDNASRGGSNSSEGVYVSHDIVAANLLLSPGNLKVVVGDFKMLLHLLEGFRGDGLDAKLSLRLCEQQPKPAPLRVARALAKEPCHFWAAVSRRQGRLIRIVWRLRGISPISCHFELRFETYFVR